MRNRILKWLNVPICVGIGRTKTQAKIAKKHPHFHGVCKLIALDPCTAESYYQSIVVQNIYKTNKTHQCVNHKYSSGGPTYTEFKVISE